MKSESSTKLTAEQEKHLSHLLMAPEAKAAQKILHRLCKSGFEAYMAGGCVRDLILGRNPQDYDIASSASPEEVEKLFLDEKTIPVGKQFGIVIVVMDGFEIEVARFRGEKDYKDGRHPEKIYFSDVKEDALRRDFTMNALFLDLEKREIIDFVGGVKDLQNNLLRAVGDPLTRIEEDHLRVLRAFRFMSQLSCQMEPALEKAVTEKAALVQKVSHERLFQEWEKLLFGKNHLAVLELITNKKILDRFFSDVLGRTDILGSIFPAENPWIAFWIWTFLSGTPKAVLEGKWVDLKGSRAWQQQMENALFWFFEPQAFLLKSLGEILETSFRPGSALGLKYFVKFQKVEQHPTWLNYSARKRELGENLPAPLLRGEDLKTEFQGPELGRRLRLAYWLQLEGTVKTKEQALAAAQ
jgi:tRNA nucleotidyltransferase/poly(A) polymerase